MLLCKNGCISQKWCIDYKIYFYPVPDVELKRCLLLERKVMTILYSILKSTDITLPTKVHQVKAMVFPVVKYGCESWTIKKAEHRRRHFWNVLLKTLESPMECKEIQPVHTKRDQSWVFFGRTNIEAEIPLLWPLDAKSWLIWKDTDAGKDWRQKEKWMTEDEMVGWHHQLKGHTFEYMLGVGDGQGGLAKWLNWTEFYVSTTSEERKSKLSQKMLYKNREVFYVWNITIPQVYTCTKNLQHQFNSIQSLSHVRLFVIPWTAALQSSLSITNFQACPNSCPSSWWCHPAISSSVVSFSSWPQSFPALRSFPMSTLFAWVCQSIGASASVPLMNTQDCSFSMY